ncbi:MAG: polysaccharide biosynthesis C-terminal domain-containing protein [Clostridia bacterium]|nr:polysaccharide biosynthesis C-terminal domain-containing protein [Clostridia bacterium]MBQ4619116.1 polysaccharide biosynthesis C-terminal domain-containing protein [Clostridia bacterium]MBQ9857090.1 polysaccharide biosynthesis C-terminal domain-containing protein [Clostridia bacterium]
MLSKIKPYLGDKAFYKKVLKIAVPISAQSLITVGVNLMDTVMLSQYGDAQLAASAQAGSFISLFQIFCMGIGMGASVLTARYWGMKEMPSLKKTITIMLRFLMVFAGVFTLATIFFPGAIMSVYARDEGALVLNHAITYIKWMIPTYFCMGLTLTCTIILRSVGQMKIPLYCSIFAFFVNIFFNWVFIFGNLGAPEMEIAGAALGTLIARIFELFFICGYFFFIDKKIGYRIRDFFMKCSDLIREYVRVSVPVLISDGLLAIGNNLVAIIIGGMGGAFMAANSVTTMMQQLSSVLTQGVSHASCIITGHTMGEGDTEKVQRQGYTFLFFSFVLGLFAAVVILILSPVIVNYYDISLEAKEIAYHLMDAISLIIVFQAMSSILTKGVLRAGGDTTFLMAGDILFLWVASVPLGYLAGLVFHWPPFWVYTMLKIDQVIKCIWCFFRLRSGKWMKKIKKAGE